MCAGINIVFPLSSQVTWKVKTFHFSSFGVCLMHLYPTKQKHSAHFGGRGQVGAACMSQVKAHWYHSASSIPRNYLSREIVATSHCRQKFDCCRAALCRFLSGSLCDLGPVVRGTSML
jgi:hypothetical protein